ncbi:MAG: alpha/beta hydrolase fold domain-containing protein [Acidimicrobiales bacterium]
MTIDAQQDPRLDPRLRTFLAMLPAESANDVKDRNEILEQMASPEAKAMVEMTRAVTESWGNEEIAPSTGLRFEAVDVVSQPDGNTIKLQIVRPDNDDTVACVYYIHGGAMATLSSFYGNYRAWARIIAAHGLAVVLVEFRNSVGENALDQVAPYPAGLNDCVAGLKWTINHAADYGVDTSRVVVSGESGGGNLALATTLRFMRAGEVNLIKGVYALCPYINGVWPDDRYPSTVTNNGIFINVYGNWGPMSYGIEAIENHDPLAWPGFATVEDVTGFPPTVISVNECDPLHDEGVAFYRLLLSAGVAARGRDVLGTMHGTELTVALCPEITQATARDLAAFAKG